MASVPNNATVLGWAGASVRHSVQNMYAERILDPSLEECKSKYHRRVHSYQDYRPLRESPFFSANHLASLQANPPRTYFSSSQTNGKSLDASKETTVVPLDIVEAFDALWYDGLLARLKSICIEAELLTFLENYLRDINIQVVMQGEESPSYPTAEFLKEVCWDLCCGISFSCNELCWQPNSQRILQEKDQRRTPLKNYRTRLFASIAGVRVGM